MWNMWLDADNVLLCWNFFFFLLANTLHMACCTGHVIHMIQPFMKLNCVCLEHTCCVCVCVYKILCFTQTLSSKTKCVVNVHVHIQKMKLIKKLGKWDWSDWNVLCSEMNGKIKGSKYAASFYCHLKRRVSKSVNIMFSFV